MFNACGNNRITIVCHNTAFDIDRVMRSSINEANLKLLEACNIVCTMKSSTNICKLNWGIHGHNNYKWPKLEELANHLCIDLVGFVAHDALSDVMLTRKCYIKLNELSAKQLAH